MTKRKTIFRPVLKKRDDNQHEKSNFLYSLCYCGLLKVDCLFCTIYFPIVVAKNHYLGLQQILYIKYQQLEKGKRKRGKWNRIGKSEWCFWLHFFNELYLGYTLLLLLIFFELFLQLNERRINIGSLDFSVAEKRHAERSLHKNCMHRLLGW